MGKVYCEKNVFDAFMERLAVIFAKCDHVIVAFSGGKDSGLLLELVNLYYAKEKPDAKVSVYHIDYEGNYQHTIDYVARCMGKYPYFDYYHLCMPVSASCGVSMYQSTWMPWNPEEKSIWIKEPPPGAVTLANHAFDFFRIGMSDYIFQTKFGRWLHEKNRAKRTAVLVAIRAQESLNRYHAVTRNEGAACFEGLSFSTRIFPDIYNFYPLYDWRVEDVWTANYKNSFDYNKLYDLFYLAGVPLADMRVANPYHICGVNSLKLYRAIEPNTWAKLVARVNGANFGAIYGGTKAMGYKEISLPKGHTWKSYTEFLLNTLPKQTANVYRKKFEASHYYWLEKGGALPVSAIKDLEKAGVKMERLGKPRGNRKYSLEYEAVRFYEYPDRVYSKYFRSIPSYKRMCITILKNDTSCKYMGFSQTRDELQKQREAMEIWENLM
jgi:predicted phosphoadenosine phosphosulfate sulfurtransferase